MKEWTNRFYQLPKYRYFKLIQKYRITTFPWYRLSLLACWKELTTVAMVHSGVGGCQVLHAEVNLFFRIIQEVATWGKVVETSSWVERDRRGWGMGGIQWDIAIVRMLWGLKTPREVGDERTGGELGGWELLEK